MSQTKVTKAKARQEKPLKVMHRIENGTITSRTVDPKAPKLREAVDPVQQAESTGHQVPKTKAKPPEKQAPIMTDEQRSILKALNDLGADKHPIDVAKHLGYTHKGHKYENAPRSPVRRAMEALSKLHFVTIEKNGPKYSYTIADKGKEALKGTTHNPAPASTASTDSKRAAKATELKTVEQPPKIKEAFVPNMPKCAKCSTINLQEADYCRECGTPMKAAVPLLAA